MANSLIKTTAHNSFADSIYSEIMTRTSRYYYFLGRTLPWVDEANPPPIVDSITYERESRNEIIAFKEITSSDISYVIPRIDWTLNTPYDNYDDQYSSEIQGLNLTSGGSGYLTTPTITIGVIVPISQLITANSQYFYNGYLYSVTAAGTSGSSNSVLLNVIGNTYTHGTSVLTCVGIQATATCSVGTSGVNNQKVTTTSIVNRGFGYTTAPTVTFSSGTASATAVVKLGKLENTNYYVYSDLNIYICVDNNNKGLSTIAPSGISSGYLNTSDGYIWKYMSTVTSDNKFLINNFIPVNTVSKNSPITINQYSLQAQTEIATVTGNICSLKIVSGGYGYSNPTISIIGDGTGATATATITGGVISKISISNRGTNYNWANIVITDSAGTGAIARAIVSPFGGLGKDPINHISCRHLMFYAKVSDNTNQGLTVTNDYRQVGIVKNPLQYNTDLILTSNFATPCWKITATSAINLGIVADSIVSSTINSVTYRFRVVSVSGSIVLLIPLDNGIPTSTMTFSLTPLITFIASTVVPPTVNKYSGDLLYLSNETAFVATSESPAVLRTIIKL